MLHDFVKPAAEAIVRAEESVRKVPERQLSNSISVASAIESKN